MQRFICFIGFCVGLEPHELKALIELELPPYGELDNGIILRNSRSNRCRFLPSGAMIFNWVVALTS